MSSEAGVHGPEARLDSLMAEHLPGLRGFLRRRVPEFVLERESTEDIVQSVCREVLEHLHDGRLSLRGEREFKQWLYEAALWKLRSRKRYLRAQRRDPRREVRPGRASLDVTPHPVISETPSRLLASKERREAVHQAIESLGGRDTEVLRFAVLEERTHAEIAQLLGVSPAHSRVLLSRALARLARRLEGV